jgi:hypothetical protein
MWRFIGLQLPPPLPPSRHHIALTCIWLEYLQAKIDAWLTLLAQPETTNTSCNAPAAPSMHSTQQHYWLISRIATDTLGPSKPQQHQPQCISRVRPLQQSAQSASLGPVH